MAMSDHGLSVLAEISAAADYGCNGGMQAPRLVSYCVWRGREGAPHPFM
jgi:hypothetical protein